MSEEHAIQTVTMLAGITWGVIRSKTFKKPFFESPILNTLDCAVTGFFYGTGALIVSHVIPIHEFRIFLPCACLTAAYLELRE